MKVRTGVDDNKFCMRINKLLYCRSFDVAFAARRRSFRDEVPNMAMYCLIQPLRMSLRLIGA